jgi:DNA modification methylase
MKPYYSDQGVTIWQGDVRDRLRQLPADTFNTCVTSPPYWGLRDYGTAKWDGGDSDCDHTLPSRANAAKATATSTLGGAKDSQGHLQEPSYRKLCGKCGALRTDHQLGLESTPDEYVANMVDVFREVRRTLRDDGTLWLNIGDSYASTTKGTGGAPVAGSKLTGGTRNILEGQRYDPRAFDLTACGLKSKDLVGIPWMLAFALRADGWYLRADIIWAKAVSFCPTYNGTTMPESVRDRPTKAHEYIFLLSKSDRYHYDFDAVKEAAQDWGTRDRTDGKYSASDAEFGLTPHKGLSDINFAEKGRNLRSVWTVMPASYPGAHFATFPEDLARPCILAGAPVGGHVLEPFCGSGTTVAVARDEGRRATGIELNPEYCGLITKRLAQGVLFGGAA